MYDSLKIVSSLKFLSLPVTSGEVTNRKNLHKLHWKAVFYPSAADIHFGRRALSPFSNL